MIRYVEWISEIKAWLKSDQQLPRALEFKLVRSHHSRSVFDNVCTKLGIGKLGYTQGVLTPQREGDLGFVLGVEVAGEIKHRFLIALEDGKLLSRRRDVTPEFISNLHFEPSNALMRLLWKVTPIDLVAALQPRRVLSSQSKRINLFKGGSRAAFSPYVFLSAACEDSEILPKVSGSDLLAGEKRVTLVGAKTGLDLAIVTLIETAGKIKREVTRPHTAGSSQSHSKQFSVELEKFIRAETLEPPQLPLLPLWSNAARRARLVGIARAHITIPSNYPFTLVSAEIWRGPKSESIVGLWAPGASRFYNNPFKTAILHSAHRISICRDYSWKIRGEVDKKTICDVQRWLRDDMDSKTTNRVIAIYAKNPIIFYRTFLDPRSGSGSLVSRDPDDFFLRSREFKRLSVVINPKLAAAFSRSWPYLIGTAALLAGVDPRADQRLAAYLDASFALPTDPESSVDFMSGFAPEVFRRSLQAARAHVIPELAEIVSSAAYLRNWLNS